MKVVYVEKRFNSSSLAVIEWVNDVIEEYQAQGFDLTLRQLFYQGVSRDFLPNTQREYKRLGSIINDARLAGLVDWDAIVDRTRKVEKNTHWDSPSQIIEAAADGYQEDKWVHQPNLPECFPGSVPVVTEDGPRDICDVKVGDRILVDDGSFKRVTRIFRRKYEGDLVELTATGLLPVLCTPDHPIYCRPYDVSRPGYKGSERKYLDDSFVMAKSLKRFDLLFFPRIRGEADRQRVEMMGGSKSKKVSCDFDYLLCSVVGIYLAEGRVREDGRTVQFTIPRSEEHQERILVDWADHVGLKSHIVVDRNTKQIYIYSKAFCMWLRHNFSSGSFNKRLPKWFVLLPYQKQMLVLKFYFFGDGCFYDTTRSSIRATTRSYSLAAQVQQVLVRNGYGASFTSQIDAGHSRYEISVNGAFAQRLSAEWDRPISSKQRHYNWIKMEDEACLFPVKQIRRIAYSGFVFNLEVERKHVYCVPFVVHNCWIEKDALVGVISGICKQLDVSYFSCRGYTSQSAMYKAACRLRKRYINNHQKAIIIQLSDHDPSGLDMTRDIRDRLLIFDVPSEVIRIALNMDQVEQFNPPPNPTKITDPRAGAYIDEYGTQSWELDAMEPSYLANLVRMAVEEYRDDKIWEEALGKEDVNQRLLERVADSWDDVVEDFA